MLHTLPSFSVFKLGAPGPFVPTGSPSRDGDVTVYVWNKPTSLPTPFYSVLASISVFMALSTVTLRFLALFFWSYLSVLLVLSTLRLFIKVPCSPDIIPRDWPGSKHQLTNSWSIQHPFQRCVCYNSELDFYLWHCDLCFAPVSPWAFSLD